MNSEFGTTAWGRGWVRLAAPTTLTRPNPAIPRGLSLARNDRVRDLEIAPGSLTALVDDNSTREVHIALPAWDHCQLDVARRLLAGTVADNLRDEHEAALTHAGLCPVPEAATVTTDCPCTSRTKPCAHVIAVCFEIARRIDERPSTALVLRGVVHDTRPATALIPLSLIDPVDFYQKPPPGPQRAVR
ncbi:MAG TPA: hypothetical protein VFU74_03575 [Actinocrinis sp.]|nr:hypothetical protein [Actinocrinis sp.]